MLYSKYILLTYMESNQSTAEPSRLFFVNWLLSEPTPNAMLPTKPYPIILTCPKCPSSIHILSSTRLIFTIVTKRKRIIKISRWSKKCQPVIMVIVELTTGGVLAGQLLFFGESFYNLLSRTIIMTCIVFHYYAGALFWHAIWTCK